MRCTICNNDNDSKARFCSKCGSQLTLDATANEVAATAEGILQQNLTSQNLGGKAWYKKTLTITVIIFLVIGGIIAGGAYYYNLQIQKNNGIYLSEVQQISQDIFDLNDELSSLIDSSQTFPVTEVNAFLEKHKNTFTNFQVNLKKQVPPQKWTAENEKVIDCVKRNALIFDKVKLLINNPVSKETDYLMKDLRSDVKKTEEQYAALNFPGASFDFPGKMNIFADRLALYLEDQQKLSKEQQEQAKALTTFYQEMDSFIQRYQGAKSDLSSSLESARNGYTTWGSYYNLLDEAIAIRRQLRDEVNLLKSPQSTESLRNSLATCITSGIHIVEKRKSIGQMERDQGYYAVEYLYNSLEEEDSKVQKQFSKFLEEYQSSNK